MMYSQSTASNDLQFLTHYANDSAECRGSSPVEEVGIGSYDIVGLEVEPEQSFDDSLSITSVSLQPYKIFSEVTAKLPQNILNLVPGSEDFAITSLEDVFNVNCTFDVENSAVLLKGDIQNLTKLENSLRHRIFGVPQFLSSCSQTDHAELKDSSVSCDLLNPVYSKYEQDVEPHSFDQNVINDSMLATLEPGELQTWPKRKKLPQYSESSCVETDVQLLDDCSLSDHQDIIDNDSPEKLDDTGDNDEHHIGTILSALPDDEPKLHFEPKKKRKDYEKLAPFKFFCQLCSFKTKRESHFKNHMLIHEKNPDCSFYGCDQCNFVTLRLGHLRRHEAKHSVIQFKCQKCKYSTDSEKLLTRHMQQKHNANKKRPKETFSCPKCTYTTKTQPLLMRHLNVHLNTHADTDPELIQSYRCQHCDYVTVKKEHFCRHMLCHSDKRPYLCDLCGASFKRQDTLRQHKVCHLDREVRNYQHVCPHCEKTFRSTAHLADHMTIHTNVRAYLCEICGAAFKTKSVQRNHVNSIHKNPRSHECPHCGKKFNTKFALQRHTRSHDDEASEILTNTFDIAELTKQQESVAKETQITQVDCNEPRPFTSDSAVASQTQIMLVTPDNASYEPGQSSQLIPHAFIHTTETNSALLYLLN